MAFNIDSGKITGNRWLVALFGLIFLFGGLSFLVFFIVPDIYDGWRMQSWQSTRGTLLDVDIKTNRSNSTDTYQASARFEYILNGQRYIGTRVAISDMADDIGDFQKNLAKQLAGAFRSQQPVTIWYDPQNPTDSIINREIRWGLMVFIMIFVIVFGGLGFMIVSSAFKSKKQTPHTPQEKSQPWLLRPEWNKGEIKSDARSGMKAAWLITVFWNAISLPAAYNVMPQIVDKLEYKALAVLIFPLIGLGLLYWAIKKTLEWKRFGATPLTMDPFPGSIGGQVGGQIRIDIAYNPQQVFKITLACIHSYLSGTGNNRSRKERTTWQDEGYAQVNPGASAVNITFCFDVPENLPASQEFSDSYYLWRLTLESEMEGVDLNRSFEIPVFKTAQQSEQFNFKSPELVPAGVTRTTAESLLPLKQSGSIIELYYPMFRNPLGSFSGVVFGGIFVAVGLFLWQQAQIEGGMLYFMASVFGLIGFGVVWAGIFSALNSIQIKFDGMNLHYRHKFLFFTIKDKKIPYTDITNIDSRGSGSGKRGGKHKITYTVFAQARGKKYTLAESITSASKKDLVVQYFESLLSR